ncbi:uncharacterized protein ACLA_053290 [Aspergillus clavatus NRRL 1]|uniref:Short-chain dehydrogenase/reductase family protein n=1 Tax=Aspergillus clavatus (strain ATCC 1007 / CBS 513.65 / DSM 816 / NCTC 3887 / NRRL 1 / QM 1276 / 107) TaxID=344612 RepID=A1CJ00_ASPCL|nr:uncharacterized protein ACLA_053290 [Aspergillus clavatus NRRL 1]EAW10855.1 conserved hypothetical protein [Aspergillus clavatus NRRL 1]
MPPINPQIEFLLGSGPPKDFGKMGTIRWAAKNSPKDPTQTSFAGETVLVTGSNTGLGYQAALKFAALGASKLILAVPTISKGEEAKTKIVLAAAASTSTSASNIIVLPLDMGDFASVKTFPHRLQQAGIHRLDVAVLNAGIAPTSYQANAATGLESALQNSQIEGQGPAQLTLTGSFAHLYLMSKDLPTVTPGQSVLKAINSPQFFNAETSYAVMKLLTMYVMQGLVKNYAGREANPDVTANVVCPGLCTTELGCDFLWYVMLPLKLMQMYCARSAEEGSRLLVSATLLGTAGHGKFWTNDVFTKPGPLVTNEEGKALQEQIWAEIVDICNQELN